MKRWAFFDELLPRGSWPGLRTKLIVLLIVVMAIPLLVSSWLARHNAQSMGKRVSKQTTVMTEDMRETVRGRLQPSSTTAMMTSGLPHASS
ncbi:MAG: hypothetical protein P8182_06875 [Deltaproteobacteria bacterium]